MNEEKELVQFKEEFVKGYVDPYLDRLLDLRNAIQSAESYDEIRGLMEREQEFIKAEFGIVKLKPKKEEEKNATKKSDTTKQKNKTSE